MSVGALASGPPPRETGLRALAWACAGFAALGLLLALFGDAFLFAPWRRAAARSLFGEDRLPPELAPFVATTLGILGGSIVGKWVAAAWLAAGPLRRGERWAWSGLAAGLLAWFGVDGAASLRAGAGFNVWMINLVPLVLFGGLLLGVRRRVRWAPREGSRRLPEGAWAVLFWVCAGLAVLGGVTAFGFQTPLFSPYRQGIAAAWYGGTLPGEALVWGRFIYGPIGGTFLGHFVMLAFALRFAVGERWVLQAVATSLLAWFVVDTALCAAHGALFNVALVNLPCLVLVLPPLLLAWRALPEPQPGP